MKSVTYIEVDVPEFADTSSPIADETFRFARPTNFLPTDIEAIASIESVSYTPAEISLGEDLGKRAALDVTFRDHRHIFNGEDFEAGSFFGKWRARYGLRLIGNDLRWIQGFTSQALSDMTTRHFVIEGSEGPGLKGQYRLTAKDILKLADDDRAQAPRISKGFLASDLSDTATSATLSPTGIGDGEYPASGWVAIGGEEIAAFTRSGDVLTFEEGSPATSTRGQLGTEAAEHDAGARVQLVLRYDGVDPAVIIEDLLTTYANVPASYIDLDAWKSETESFLQRLYTATIPEPVAVNKLVSEIIEQAALAVWWDEVNQRVRLQVLREISTTAATFTPENTIADSLTIREQPRKRLSEIWVYFGQRNPLRPLDETDNFASISVSSDPQAEADYGRPAIKKIFSRWIPFGGRLVAERVGDILLARFKDPPRKVGFGVFRGGEITPVLGGGYRLEAWPIQNTDGSAADMPIQVTRLDPGEAVFRVEAEEMLFQADPIDLVNRVIIIDADINAVNMRDLHDQIYPEPTGSESPAINVTAIVESSVTVGSDAAGTPAFDVGDWPAGIDLEVIVRGRIQGRGGDGGKGGVRFTRTPGQPGAKGGTALKTATAISLVLNEGSGEVWAGGGGGGGGQEKGDPARDGGGGGGGAGTLGGEGGPPGDTEESAEAGADGTPEAGGAGGAGEGNNTAGGDGGGPGLDGQDGEGESGNGGLKGDAIDGLSFVTKTGTGDIRGNEVN